MNIIAQLTEELYSNQEKAEKFEELINLLVSLERTGKISKYRLSLNATDIGMENYEFSSFFLVMLERILGTVPKLKDEVSTQVAADFLNVSRPFLIKLLEEGEIPFRMVGSHRRIRFDDLRNYKIKIDSAREETLKELARETEHLGIGY